MLRLLKVVHHDQDAVPFRCIEMEGLMLDNCQYRQNSEKVCLEVYWYLD